MTIRFASALLWAKIMAQHASDYVPKTPLREFDNLGIKINAPWEDF